MKACVQVYQCTAVYFRGPSGESTDDGSLVEATVVASSPVPGSIPQLLLQATRNRGDGVFGGSLRALDTDLWSAPLSENSLVRLAGGLR
jgi:hypothetical protein